MQKTQGPDSRDKKFICPLNNFRDRQTNIVVPRVHWILGKLHVKNQGFETKVRKDISFFWN